MAAQPLILNRNTIFTRIADIIQAYERANITPVFGLFGPPGTGKTTMTYEIAKLLGRPWYKYACSPSGVPEKLLGGPGPDGTGVWRDYLPGTAAHAWGYQNAPGVLVLDDAHMMGRDEESAMYTVLDAGVGGTIPLPGGQGFAPQPGYVVFWTSNGSLEDLDPAIRSRTSMRFMVLRPSDDMIASLGHPEIKGLVTLDYDGINSQQVADFREWQNLDRLWGIVSLAEACLIALGDMDRAKLMLDAMSAGGIREAGQAVLKLSAGMPSGA